MRKEVLLEWPGIDSQPMEIIENVEGRLMSYYRLMMMVMMMMLLPL